MSGEREQADVIWSKEGSMRSRFSFLRRRQTLTFCASKPEIALKWPHVISSWFPGLPVFVSLHRALFCFFSLETPSLSSLFN
jgi:hypothetical protein